MPKISLSGPAELLTIIPFHLGFQPARSVVVVCFHGKRLGLVARLDLVDAQLAAEAAEQTLPTLLQGAPSSVALVGFEDAPDESLPLLEALADGVDVRPSHGPGAPRRPRRPLALRRVRLLPRRGLAPA